MANKINLDHVGYADVVCHFCGGREAAYWRVEDKRPKGPFFDSCEKCARKPYPEVKA